MNIIVNRGNLNQPVSFDGVESITVSVGQSSFVLEVDRSGRPILVPLRGSLVLYPGARGLSFSISN